MNDPKAQWGLWRQHGWFEWEETRIARSRSDGGNQTPENAAQPKTLLYGPKGEALVTQQPRRMGFRKP